MLGEALLAAVEIAAGSRVMALQDVQVRLDAFVLDGLALEEIVQVCPLRIQAFVIFGFRASDDPDEPVDQF